jgi:CheY-like chemotaxis protein
MSTILLIDADSARRSALEAQIAALCNQVILAPTGDEGLRRWADNLVDVDIVVLSLHLPDMAGVEVFDLARQFGWKQPVIVLAAEDEMEEALQSWRRGAISCLLGAIDLPTVEAALRQAETARAYTTALSRRLHDVRSPLAAIIMQLEMLSNPNITLKDSERCALMAATVHQSKRLLNHIDSFYRR